MTENRPLTKDELLEMQPLIEHLKLANSFSISRFVDTQLNKMYDAYLFSNENKTFVVKKNRAAARDKQIFDLYFKDRHFSIPHIWEHTSIEGDSYMIMEFADGHDARNCSVEDAKRIGVALAQIQSYHLTTGGLTDSSEAYFEKYVASRCQKLETYFDDFNFFYQIVRKRFFEAPHTVIHDDLLPINVILGTENLWIIDWETTGVLPYFLDLARFAFVYNKETGFYISHESGMAFLEAYYDEMKKNPHFSIDKRRFYLDVAIAAFCQYSLFLYYETDTENISSTIYFQFLRKIMDFLHDSYRQT